MESCLKSGDELFVVCTLLNNFIIFGESDRIPESVAEYFFTGRYYEKENKRKVGYEIGSSLVSS